MRAADALEEQRRAIAASRGLPVLGDSVKFMHEGLVRFGRVVGVSFGVSFGVGRIDVEAADAEFIQNVAKWEIIS